MTEREAIESTYFDHCSTYRRIDTKDPETKQTKQTETAVLQNIPCALSQNKGRELSLNGDYGKASGSYTLFCAPDTDMVKGDKAVVTTGAGQIFTLWAGKPFSYAGSHCEVPLSEDDRS
nr:hypothetical protein [uncultured Caproiciproducens sp.]